ncbi:hypothetical protein MCEMSE6_02509 [Oxalobacteraceae bacterium]
MKDIIRIEAVIRTESPLSIKMPVAEGSRENHFENFPIMTRGIDADGNKLQTGFLPATTLRGFLRRAIVLRSMKKASDDGKPYRLPQIYTEMIGQDADSEKQSDDIDLQALKAARESSPVLDLFGSGLGIKSRLKVGHFVPSVNVLPEVFTGVRKDLDDTEDALDLMDNGDMQSFLGRSQNNNQRAAAASVVKQLEGKIRRDSKKNEVSEDDENALEVAKANLEKFKTGMGDMQVSTRTIVQHFALPSHVDLHGRIIIDKANEKDLEMIVYSLSELSKAPILGAHSARGCGEISGKFDFYDGSGKQLKTVTIGGFSEAKVTNF